MATRQYIGARYVPRFDGDWDNTKDYEPLVIVSYQGNSYTSRTFVPHGTAITNEEYWALTGNYNAQVEAYRQEVAEYVEDVKDLVSDVNLFKLESPYNLNGNLVIDYFHNSDYYIQGSCYIGDNKVVAYFSTDTDTGKLVCFNLTSKAIVWSYDIEAYHGNSISYRQTDHCIYIASGEDNKIIVVDVLSPSVIKSVIEAPVDTIYSIAYDDSTDTFYSINKLGTTEGEANLLFKYVGIFESVDQTITLKNYPSVKYQASAQGIQLIKDGIIYVLGYSYKNKYIIGNDIQTGEAVVMAQQPYYINMYRNTGESEALIYNYDYDVFYIAASQPNTGYSGVYNAMIYEIDLFTSIDIMVPPIMGTTGYYTNEDRIVIDVDDENVNSLSPYDGVNIPALKCPQDAITLGILLQKFLIARMKIASNIVEGIKLNGFTGIIRAINSSSKITINNLTKMSGVNIQFADCIFTGKVGSYQINANTHCNISFFSCVFEDVDGITAHIFAEQNCTIFVRETDCVFNSTKRKFVAGNGSIINSVGSGHFTEKSSDNFNPVADIYVYTGLVLENDNYEKSLARFHLSQNGTAVPTGIILSNSDSSISTNHLRYIYEPDTPAYLCMSPLFMLNRNSTYYVWAKYNGNSTGEIAYADVKKIDIGYM